MKAVVRSSRVDKCHFRGLLAPSCRPIDVLIRVADEVDQNRRFAAGARQVTSPLAVGPTWAQIPRDQTGRLKGRGMFPPEMIFKELTTCWDLSSCALFQNFLAANPGVTRWMISADYCLRDTSRANDCYAFSIMPMEDDFKAMSDRIRAALPKDIKRARYLTQEGANLLADPRHFHLVIVVPKDRDVFNNGQGSNPLEISREVANKTLDRAKEMERGDNTTKPLKKMVEAARANNFNFELYGDLLLLGFFFPFVSLLLTRERKSTVIGWMSDRDNMTTWGDGVIWNQSTESFVGLGELLHIDVVGTDIRIAVPGAASGPMWFDEMIRLPDYYAGTVAAWDAPANTLPPNPKSLLFVQMLEHVVAGAKNGVILRLDIGADGLQWRRIAVNLCEGHVKVPLGPQPDLHVKAEKTVVERSPSPP